MIKYEQMGDFEINKLVTREIFSCHGWSISRDGVFFHNGSDDECGYFIQTIKDYCNNPSDAFPIILKYEIAISPYNIGKESPEYEEYKDMWFAMKDKDWYIDDKNPLRAAMIIFLMMKEAEKESVEAL